MIILPKETWTLQKAVETLKRIESSLAASAPQDLSTKLNLESLYRFDRDVTELFQKAETLKASLRYF